MCDTGLLGVNVPVSARKLDLYIRLPVPRTSVRAGRHITPGRYAPISRLCDSLDPLLPLLPHGEMVGIEYPLCPAEEDQQNILFCGKS